MRASCDSAAIATGDNDAEVELFLEGGGVLRRCGRQELINWSTSDKANIHAGVNTFGAGR